MGQDFSWDKSAVEYIKLYSEVLGLDYREQITPKMTPLVTIPKESTPITEDTPSSVGSSPEAKPL
jgi:starch synthase